MTGVGAYGTKGLLPKVLFRRTVQAFSLLIMVALEYYHERTVDYVGRLERHIEALSVKGATVDASDWFYWLSFDIMGEFAFGKSFHMLEDEKWHVAISMLRSAMRLLGPFSSVPWLAQIGFSFFPNTAFIGEWHAMMNFCKDRMRERLEVYRTLRQSFEN